jgi:signal transduction histidine kinase
VLVLGIASLVLLAATDRLGQTERSYFARANAIMDLRTMVAQSHLWLEEAIAGRDRDEMDRARSDLREAKRLMEVLLRGGESEHGLIVKPLTDPPLLRQVEEISALMSEWQRLFEEQLQHKDRAGEGSPLEARGDLAFDKFMRLTADLEREIEGRLNLYHIESRGFFIGILLTWSSLMLASVGGLLSWGRKRRHAEEALRRANDLLEVRVAQRTSDLNSLNDQLRVELGARRRSEEALRESEGRLRHLSARLLTTQETERRRISTELHDALGHPLILAKLHVGSIRRELRSDRSPARQSCDDLSRSIDQVIEEIRRLCRDLRPAVLDDLGLAGSLRGLADNHCRNGHATISLFTEDIDHLLLPGDQVIIYRVIQEAFTNIEKHAHAKNISLSVERQRTCFRFP